MSWQSSTFWRQLPSWHLTSVSLGHLVLVEQSFLLDTHLPSQQWNCPGLQIRITQSFRVKAQERSGQVIEPIGQVSIVGQASRTLTHSPLGHLTSLLGQVSASSIWLWRILLAKGLREREVELWALLQSSLQESSGQRALLAGQVFFLGQLSASTLQLWSGHKCMLSVQVKGTLH